MCRELDLQLEQECLGFGNIMEFCNVSPSHIKIVKGDQSCLFSAISYLLAGTQELYIYIELKVTEFIRSNAECKAYPKKPTWSKLVSRI